MSLFRKLGLILAILFSLTLPTFAATYTYDSRYHDVVITGEFTSPTEYQNFFKLLDDHQDIKGVRLINSPGGDAQDMVEIGAAVHDKGLWTWASGYCHSACGYIWLAGSNRYADHDAFLVEHLPNSNGLISIDSFNILAYYLGYIHTPYNLLTAIESQSNYFDNKPFNFLDLIDSMDPQHKFYKKLAENMTPNSP